MSQDLRHVSDTDAPPARQRRPKRTEVRARLIAGAMEAFSIKGFAGSSIDFICARAGFSRGAFYSNFEDKEALFFALYDQRINRLYDRLGKIADLVKSADDPWGTVALHLRDPDPDELRWDILNKEFIVHALRNDAARARLLESRAGSKARLAEILVSLDPGFASDKAQLDRLCRMIIALHEGELTQLGLDPGQGNAPSLLSEFLPLVLAGIAARNRA
ncbi:TetR/AcrR family transcriptional regulator [Shimia sp. SDUM112013]|uniref:TetR/AcrR family transcriptional regulator n=1 Tax=Shimia sp. SDUM112013 TaxID=3136160 RepID=UPI0032F009CC